MPTIYRHNAVESVESRLIKNKVHRQDKVEVFLNYLIPYSLQEDTRIANTIKKTKCDCISEKQHIQNSKPN